MTNMIERVARAMVAADSGPEGSQLFDIHWAEFGPGYLVSARAAIEVMREPTVEMLIAAQEEWMCVRAAEQRGDFIWRAMIDAALKPEVQP